MQKGVYNAHGRLLRREDWGENPRSILGTRDTSVFDLSSPFSVSAGDARCAGMLCRIGRDTAVEASPMSANTQGRKLLTNADAFRDVSRGNPKPFTLKGEELVKARLTPSTWRLEILAAGSAKLQRPRRLEDNTAINLPMLEDLGKRARGQVSQGDAVPQYRSAARPGTVGRRAAARGIETRRQNSATFAASTGGASTITIPNSSFSPRSVTVRSWRRRREICRCSSRIGSTAGRSPCGAAGRCG